MRNVILNTSVNDRLVTNADAEQRMTSLEIARLAGKQHKDVMRAIRNMEAAWANVCGRNFALTSRIIKQPNGGTREVPCYSLTKTETLYIATKFHDEARARLVLRWEQLELQERRRWMAQHEGGPRSMVDLRGSRGARVFLVVPGAGTAMPLPVRMLEWRPWHGPVRRLVCRTAHGIVREGLGDYTLYVRIPQTLPQMLGTTPGEVLEAEVSKLLNMMEIKH